MKLTKVTACAAALLTAAVAVTTSAGCGKDKPADETTVEQTTVEQAAETTESFETTTAAADSETVPSAETEVATATNDVTAAEQSTAESTTAKENETVKEQEKTTAAENVENTSSDSVNENSAGNEFNIVITDNFYMTGESIDSSGAVTPLEIAKTSKSLYMLSDFDGIAMGALINGETAYMICPEKKIYLEITATLSKTMGLDDSDMFDVSSYSFSDIGSLSNAKSTEQNVDFQGVKCTAYTFDRETSQSVFYMNGNKLVGFVTANLDGSDPVTTVVSSVSAEVPADRIEPPADYKSYKGVIGAVRFMAALGITE